MCGTEKPRMARLAPSGWQLIAKRVVLLSSAGPDKPLISEELPESLGELRFIAPDPVPKLLLGSRLFAKDSRDGFPELLHSSIGKVPPIGHQACFRIEKNDGLCDVGTVA